MDGYGPSSYGDAIAAVYDEWYGDRGDISGAVNAIASMARGGRVLELGIGSGRLALPLAAAGIDVWGIDASAAMVERLRAKPGGERLPVAIGDMGALDLSSLSNQGAAESAAEFAVVFAADNTFFNLTTEESQRRCLERACTVLAPGGQLVLEAFVPALDAPPSSIDTRTVAIDHVVLTVTRHDRDSHTVAGQHIELRESGIRLHPWMVRYATPDELDRMAADAGLHLSRRWRDWSGAPFTDDDNTHVSVYTAG